MWKKSLAAAVIGAATLLTTVRAGGAENLLRNGSFEVGERYWYEAELPGRSVVAGDASHGTYALKIERDGVASAAFLLEQHKPVTFSFSARVLEGTGTMGWQLTPCSREVGTKNNLTWSMKHHHPVKLTDRWQRFSFTFTPTVPTDGFWPRPTYMAQLGDCEKPFLIDAVSVTYADAKAYAPWRAVEVSADCPDLKGYAVDGNLFEKGATVTLLARAANTTEAPRRVTLRWQLIDYEGVRPLNAAQEKTITLAPGQAVAEAARMDLIATGMVLARVSAVDADGKVIDQSDLPLTSLPYPKSATRPDPRERFGGSLFGDHSMKLAARLGFGWTRWKPQMTWLEHQPDGPDAFRWFDKELDDTERHGFSTHLVLHQKPKWAFDDGAVLPRDMQWPVDDPRWNDLTPQCSWDRFVTATVKRYAGRKLIYEIQNEPEFDWEQQPDLYARFTLRTARMIKQTDPAARVMINNVYGIPSRPNGRLLELARDQKAFDCIDVISWHDYHDGWLADHVAIRKMKDNLAALGFGKAEIWFNEGWSFTNTAVDEPAVALTNFNAAQSTNATIDSVAELTANGQAKTILFYTGYDDHGMSFWDYAGPGTMLWDYYGYPLPLAAAWNTLNHHVGLSDVVGFVRPAGANVCVFQDLRNQRGVMIAYADRDASADVPLSLPGARYKAEDVMGNAVDLGVPATLRLSKTCRPVIIYAADQTSGVEFLKRLAPSDRRHDSFVAADGQSWRLPAAWPGTRKGSADNNPIAAGAKPVWRMDQVWPDDPTVARNYTPLDWTGTTWKPKQNDFGGQPEARVENGAVDFAVRAPWTGTEGQRIAGLVFIAPKAGTYRLTGRGSSKPWEGGAEHYKLGVFKKDTQRATRERVFDFPRDGAIVPLDLTLDLSAGHELVLLPLMPDWHNATHTTLADIKVELLPRAK